MANINDYLAWRGDLPINRKFKFNEIDSMVLARFSYLIFSKIKMNPTETIESIAEKMKDFKNEQFRYNGDKEMITKLGTSERFKNMVVTDYVETNDKEIEKQFGAITVHISDTEIYVSFIGTDSTIYGWKEDFNMCFMKSVPCQISGKKYLERIANKYHDCKIRIGGHSKGGNVAIYSAAMVSPEIQDRIIKVYNYDGQGFNQTTIDSVENNKILNKIETYIPQDSVIGRIMEHKEKCTVIKSDEKGILQHDIFSWQVLKDDIVKEENVTISSDVINRTLTDWIASATYEQRKLFIDGVFELFYSTDARTFKDISNKLPSNIIKMIKTYKNISEDERKTITEMLKVVTKIYFSAVKDAQATKLTNMKDNVIKSAKKREVKNKRKR